MLLGEMHDEMYHELLYNVKLMKKKMMMLVAQGSHSLEG